MNSETIQFESRRQKPNLVQVEKIKNQLDQLIGLSTNKQIDFVFDGINSWEKGYNLATITAAFMSDREGEWIDDIPHPRRDSMYDMKVKLREYRNSTQCENLVLYPSRGPTKKGEWRYFNMQKIDEYDLIEKMDKSIIKALKKWIKHITTILKNDPEERNETHKKIKSEIRYQLMLRRRMLRQLERKNKKVIVPSSSSSSSTTIEDQQQQQQQQQQKGEQQNNETDEQ